MKKHLLLLFLICIVQFAQSQEATQQSRDGHVTLLKKNEAALSKDGHVTLLKKNAAMVYLGGGLQNLQSPKTDFKTQSGLIDLNVFVPFYSAKKFSLGINTGFDYAITTKGTLPKVVTPTGYNVFGQDSLSPVITEKSSFSKGTSFGFAAGPQLNYWVSKKFILSPIMHFGYIKNSSTYTYDAVQQTNFNGTLYNFDLLNIKQINTSGLGIIPKLRFHYMFSKRIGIWAEGSYIAGPKTETEIKTFSPNGQPFEGGFYEIGNLQEGIYSIQKYESTNNGWAVKGGIVISFGGKKPIKQNESLITNTNSPSSTSAICNAPVVISSICDGDVIRFNVEQSWVNQSAGDVLTIIPTYLDATGSPRVINVTIPGNSSALNASNGNRGFSIPIPNTYLGQEVCFKTRIQSGRSSNCISEVCSIVNCNPTCSIRKDSTYCIDRRSYVTFTSSWNNSTPFNHLYITLKANGVIIPGLNIPNNNTAINSSNGSRSFTVEIPNSYIGQTITVEQNICKPTDPPSGCCTATFTFEAKDCFICENCAAVTSRIVNAGKVGNNYVVNASISSTYPITKVVAELESITAFNLPTQPVILPNPNFEFSSTTTIGGVAVTMPFSLYQNRSNVVVSNISAATTVPMSFVIDNMNNKSSKTYKIKLIIFMNDGSRCERYISSGDRIYENSNPIPNR